MSDTLNEKRNKFIDTIPNFDKYTEENQNLLIETFKTAKEVKKYCQMDFRKSDCKYKVESKQGIFYFHISKNGMIGMKRDIESKDGWRITAETIYTLCKQLEAKPTDFEKLKV